MNSITVTVSGERRDLPAGFTLKEAIEAYSPYGEEAVICRLNGEAVKSIDEATENVLHDGDVLEIYPLIIGG